MEKKFNFVMISPNFPDNFIPFAQRLKAAGFNTLGIADTPYEHLPNHLKAALTDYYQVDNMEEYEQVYRATAFFAHKYGRIDRIESHNEYWLELDARLRTDFNVFGYKTADLAAIKYKSKMKEVFRSLDLPVAAGATFANQTEALALVSELGYPVIIKPDNGVGASDTYKINHEQELVDFFNIYRPDVTYIMEEFIAGDIVTFDGLADHNGQIVFSSSLIYNVAVLETVEKNDDMYFFISRTIEAPLQEMGTKMVEAFGVRERFFHFEFFKTSDGTLMPLEVNMRPPGGSSIDMFNYANDIDVFAEYANIVKDNQFKATVTRPYYCAYISRKYGNHTYAYDTETLREKLGSALIDILTISGIFAAVMGDEGYLIRTPSEEQLYEYIHWIRKKI